MTRILVLNGPNLNRLGSRQPEVYGSGTLADLERILNEDAPEGVEIDLRQSNYEGQLVEWIHEAVDTGTPVILNAGALTHYSFALRDAIALLKEPGVPLIEVHISNVHARDEFRHTSVISAVSTGVIAGFGFDSYRLALVQLTAFSGR
ncbi:type II 3-dehydroquinate dehydratase [Mycetocola tolaasinivorans]|uniref:3-dehydroquinate dehydratase n=1 Tax=Mycetocola tolaasinivorans TaxID=76635 RepID=A0A3L7AA32_9MICO|nr:type II 3-dehydroquinate dehydratase [Mycetocola tolaasinivorans]RLP77057.1 type II 3-dehydroquinate dehydratase [Mycetocola tolaasinivorans]